MYLWLITIIIIQYYIIIISKSILSYNEELFLYSIYIILFVIILQVMSKNIKHLIIKETLKYSKFYEELYYLKMLWIKKINKLLKILLKKEKLFFLINKKNNLLLKNNFIIKNYLIINIYLELNICINHFLKKIG